MGISERKVREKQERKQRILEVAQEIASKEGWQAVTIRKIANQIEYSPPTIYEHFDSKEAILQELVVIGFSQMLSDFKTIRENLKESDEAFIQLALAYWDFAWQHPELYQVMHGLGGVAFGTENTMPEIKAVFAEVREVLHGMIQIEKHELEQLNDAVDLLWAALHGLVSLTMNGRIAGNQERARKLVIQHAEQTLAMLRNK
jgi:AcrR family transcriptional regulator